MVSNDDSSAENHDSQLLFGAFKELPGQVLLQLSLNELHGNGELLLGGGNEGSGVQEKVSL